MPTRGDNDDERTARIDRLVEELRMKERKDIDRMQIKPATATRRGPNHGIKKRA